MDPSSGAPLTEAEGAAAEFVGRQGVLFILAGACQLLAYVVALPVVTRVLDDHEYGTVAVSLVVYQAALAAVSLGLPGVVAWDIYERGAAGLAAARRLVTSTLGITVVLTLVALATGPLWIAIFSGVSFTGAVPIAVAMVVPATVAATCQQVMLAQKQAVRFVSVTLIGTIGGQSLGMALVHHYATPAAYLAGMFAGVAASAALALVWVRPHPLRWAPVGRVRAALRHGGPSVPHDLGFMVLALGDRVILERMTGLDGAGRYQSAYLLGALGVGFIQAVNYAWAPSIYRAPDATRWSLLRATTARIEWIGAAVATALALGAPLALMMMVPSSYGRVDLVPVVAIVGAAAIPNIVYLSSVHVLFQQKRTGALLYLMPIAAVVNVGLNLALIPSLDLAGAAVATLGGYLAAALAARFASRRLVRVVWDRVAEWRVHLAVAAVVVIAILLPDEAVIVVIRSVAAAACAIAALIAVFRLDRASSAGSSATSEPESQPPAGAPSPRAGSAG